MLSQLRGQQDLFADRDLQNHKIRQLKPLTLKYLPNLGPIIETPLFERRVVSFSASFFPTRTPSDSSRVAWSYSPLLFLRRRHSQSSHHRRIWRRLGRISRTSITAGRASNHRDAFGEEPFLSSVPLNPSFGGTRVRVVPQSYPGAADVSAWQIRRLPVSAPSGSSGRGPGRSLIHYPTPQRDDPRSGGP